VTSTTHGFGIDIGGSGIKGAPVDLAEGAFADDRVRIDTPEPSTPDNVLDVVLEILARFEWRGAFGCTFPGIVRNGVIGSAANVDDAWLDFPLEKVLRERTSQQVVVVNDADAVGVAEDQRGAAADVDGLVIVTTLGTGIGSALLHHGQLLPNTEFGHLYLANGQETEHWAAASVRKDEDLSWAAWAQRLQDFYAHLEFIFSPDLFVVGGGVSKKADRFLPLLDLQTPIVPAVLRNDGGIIGAAMLAAERFT